LLVGPVFDAVEFTIERVLPVTLANTRRRTLAGLL